MSHSLLSQGPRMPAGVTMKYRVMIASFVWLRNRRMTVLASSGGAVLARWIRSKVALSLSKSLISNLMSLFTMAEYRYCRYYLFILPTHTKKKSFWLVSCVGSALLASVPDVAGTAINTTKTRTWGRRSQGGITLVMMMSWCLMSSDVIWHIRDKLWPMPKHGSIKATYVRCMRV